jgi:hypothetical protein
VSTGKSPWRIRRHDNVILCATRSYSPRSFGDFSFQGNYSEARNFHVSKLNAQFRIAIDEIRAANSWSESALASPSLDDAALRLVGRAVLCAPPGLQVARTGVLALPAAQNDFFLPREKFRA